MLDKQQPKPASIVLNETETITKFPFSRDLDPASSVTISKVGDLPVYLTAYQQSFNTHPNKAGTDFMVQTSFIQKVANCTQAKSGIENRAVSRSGGGGACGCGLCNG